MDELEWWEFDTTAEMAEQVAGDIGFVIESAVAAHGGARIALPGSAGSEALLKALLKNKSIDWKKVTILPTDDAIAPADGALGSFAKLQGAFGKSGAELVRLVDDSAAGDAAAAGRAADARLAALHWPLDLVCLTVGGDGSIAAILPGPDLEKALAGPRERRAVGVRPDPTAAESPVERVTLTAAAIISARAVMIVVAGAEKRRLLEQAIQEGPLAKAPVGRLLAELDAAIDIFWSAEEA
jgi:6-phosphogluconolactonase